ncbi:DUF1816 domain-containing protein [Synechocystis sp. LKSZ1]|uniref:DUF1816 domain-containing protein n=1 Tax=Synechocystis sp. LKSZ1 TaxID=3144951 RepID=UPI00336BED30
MKELVLQFLNLLGLAHWVEIVTTTPRCTYYFGPFLSREEAETAQRGYLEDLQGEEAQGIAITIKRCKPQNLTIFEQSREERLQFQRLMPIGS